MMQIKCEEGP